MAETLQAAGGGIEVLNEVVLDQVLVRFTPPDDGDADADADADAWTRQVTIHREQNFGFNLCEAVKHTFRAKIRRTT